MSTEGDDQHKSDAEAIAKLWEAIKGGDTYITDRVGLLMDSNHEMMMHCREQAIKLGKYRERVMGIYDDIIKEFGRVAFLISQVTEDLIVEELQPDLNDESDFVDEGPPPEDEPE